MRRRWLLTVTVLVASIAVAHGATEQITVSPTADVRNLRAESGAAGTVVITYDLVASDARAIVSGVLEAAATPEAPFNVLPKSVSGDIGVGLKSGLRKRIVWDAGKDVEDVDPARFRFRVAISAAMPSTTPAPDPRSAASRAVITIVSSPDSALIAIDGRPLGLAPLEIRGVSAGTHRLTATKTGFATQTRVIKVEGGSSIRVEIPMSSATTAASAPEKKSGKGKWIAVAGGGAAAVVALAASGGKSATTKTPTATTTTTTTVPTTTTPTATTPNRAPSVTCGAVVFGGTRALQSTDVGIVSATRYQFSITSASDLDGDSLSFTYTYGNGVTSTGTYSATNNSVTYVYPGAGTYSPTVTAKDARSGEAGCQYSKVLTSTVAGEWIGNATSGSNSSRLVLTQSGVNVGGNYFEDARTASNALQGTLITNVAGRKDGSVTLTVGGSFNNQLIFVLEPSDDLKSYKGTYTYRGRGGSFEMRKTQ